MIGIVTNILNKSMIKIDNIWQSKLWEYNALNNRSFDTIDILYENCSVCPSKENIFQAFNECKFNNLKAVLCFQDPYHNGQATGIATAVEHGNIPPTLKNMFIEIDHIYKKHHTEPNLLFWEHQGVLMLNTALTVEYRKPTSHIKMWSKFTENLIKGLSNDKNITWVLFGTHAKVLRPFISKGHVFNAVHPAAEEYSGGTSGFFNSQIFKTINNSLTSKITW